LLAGEKGELVGDFGPFGGYLGVGFVDHFLLWPFGPVYGFMSLSGAAGDADGG
jgi:hypothetical protein